MSQFRVPAYSLLEWIVRSVLVVIVVGLIGWALYLDVRTFLVYSITGHVGPRGIKGVLGAVGAKGLVGPTGFVGFLGPTGPLGIAGPTGPFGSAGPTGVTGPAGPIGPTGYPNPTMQGPAGNTGSVGSTTVGPTGFSSQLVGSTGQAGPTGQRSTSSLGITWSGITGQLGPTITTVFTPSSFLTPVFGVESSYVVGPTVSNLGGNLPALLLLGVSYRISATLIATLSTTELNVNLLVPMSCQIILTARDGVTAPTMFASETIQIAPNQNTPTYSVNMRLITLYRPVIRVPVLLGFSATFQCNDIHAPSGTLLVSMATLTVVPVL